VALEQSARSFKFDFQIREVSIQLIFRDSFAAVELFDAAPDFCVDYFPVLQEPTILFFLGVQQTEQDFLDAAGAGSLKLFLDSGLEGCIVDFDVHGLTFQKGIRVSPHRICEGNIVKKTSRFLGRGHLSHLFGVSGFSILFSYSLLLEGTRMGHYCRICGRERPNEQFSGRDHSNAKRWR